MRLARHPAHVFAEAGRGVALSPGLPRAQRHHAAVAGRWSRCRTSGGGQISSSTRRAASSPSWTSRWPRRSSRSGRRTSRGVGPVHAVALRPRRPVRGLRRRLRPARHLVGADAIHAFDLRSLCLVVRLGVLISRPPPRRALPWRLLDGAARAALGASLIFGSPHHHNTSSKVVKVERVNGAISSLLRCVSCERADDWPALVALVEHASKDSDSASLLGPGFAHFYADCSLHPRHLLTPSAAQTTGPAQSGAGLLPAGGRRAGGGRGRGGGQAAEQGEVAVAGSRRGSQRRRVLARTAPITYDPTTTVSTRMLARHRGGWPGRLEAVTGAVFGICITFKFNVQSRRR